MNFIVIIPARYSAKRLPGKPLADINGKPMIVRVLDKARESGASRIIVATDHEKIISTIKMVGGEACMTRTDHGSGIERLAEVVERYNLSDETVIVNIQGDEPLIPSIIIDQAAKNLVNNKAKVTTFAVPINDIKEAFNPNIVKVVINAQGYALYFSRATIPYKYKSNVYSTSKQFIKNKLLRHLGLYSYRAGFIRRYSSWRPSPLEQMEMLEQLRILWYGKKIYVAVTYEDTGIGVDTPEDLNRIRTL